MTTPHKPLPRGFSYLNSHQTGWDDASINGLKPPVEALRYCGCENMTGRPLAGYKRNTVIATDECNARLTRINNKLQDEFGLCLVVYDSYRPRKAVEDLWSWANMPPLREQQGSDVHHYNPDRMAAKYFPKFSGGSGNAETDNSSSNNSTQTRADLFEKGYISLRSNHARGSTVDVTLVEVQKREDVRIGDKCIGVQTRHGILRMTDAPIVDDACGEGEGGIIDADTHARSGRSSRRGSLTSSSRGGSAAHALGASHADDHIENKSAPPPADPSSSASSGSAAVCTSISERGQQVFIPDFKPFDQRIREYINPKLTNAQLKFIEATEREILAGGANIVSRTSKGEADVSQRGSVGGGALDRYGSLPYIDDETVDMGTSFDLFDLASHPLWPGHFSSSNRSHQKEGSGDKEEEEDVFVGRNSAEILKATFSRDGPQREKLPEAVVAHPTFLYRRLLLQCLFEEEGFEISEEEWWHFWLLFEPFPPKADEPEYGFNFDVE